MESVWAKKGEWGSLRPHAAGSPVVSDRPSNYGYLLLIPATAKVPVSQRYDIIKLSRVQSAVETRSD